QCPRPKASTRRSFRCHHLSSDRLARNHQIDSTILASSFWRIVGSDRVVRPESPRSNRARRYSLPDQIISHRFRSLFREPLVVVTTAGVVGVAVDLNPNVWIGDQDSGYFSQPLASIRLQAGAVEVKENIRHVDDEPASTVLSL